MRQTNLRWMPMLAVGLLVGVSGCTREGRSTEPMAAREAGAPTELRTAVTDAEQEFLTKAAQGGLTEVEMGRAAVEQGRSAGVKEFGRMLIDDHRAANKEVMRLAVIKDVLLPTEPSDEQRAEITRIWDLKGAAFDREFLAWAGKDHQKDIELFEKTSNEARDADVKAFAAKTVPTLRQHAQHVQELTGQRQ